jgi:DNA/RNA-binding domain of Phe-tRNA-synthetase-like protein
MRVRINKEVFREFHPRFMVGLVFARNISHQHAKEARHLLNDVVRVIRLVHKKDKLKYHNFISPWDLLVEEKGKRARHYQTALEKLIRNVLNRRSIGARNVVTNLMRYISLKHTLPVSGDDVAKIKGDIVFAIATGRERLFIKKIKRGTLLYKDDQSIIGVKMDFRKTKRTEVTQKSTDVLIHIDALPPVTKKKLRAVVNEMAQLLVDFCGAETSVALLDREKRSVVLK